MDPKMQKLYDERMERLNNTVEHKPADKVPIVSEADTWCLGYYGISIEEALASPEEEFAAYAKVYSDIPSDIGMYPGISYPVAFASTLGSGIYTAKSDTPQIATGHSQIISADEYDWIINDTHDFLLNCVLPRKCSYLKGGTPMEKQVEGLCTSMGALLNYFERMPKNTARFKEEYGYPIPQIVPPFMPADLILDYLRDFKGTMTDVRRCPDKMAQAAMALCINFNIPATLATAGAPVYDKYLNLFLHLPPYLKPKDFEKVYWPTFKLYMDTFAQKGFKFFVMFEKTYAHLLDYLRELPKDCILGMFEDDDMKMIKEKLPNIAPYGGMRVNDLKYKTKQECLDIAKKLLDELAPGGGYAFGPNKVMLTLADGSAENYKAVCEYVHENGRY